MPSTLTEDTAIATAGEIFPQGEVLEQLANHRLLFWSSEKTEPLVSSGIRRGKRLYRAATLDPSLEAALRFPAGVKPFGMAAELLHDLEAELPGDDVARFLLATAVLGTWVAAWLPTPLLINPWGGPGPEAWLASVLSCLCRRALPIALPTPAELFALPPGLDPTLLLQSKGGRDLASLLAATGHSGAATLHQGRLLKLSYPILVHTPAPLPVPALSIPVVATASCRPLAGAAADHLASRFQPRLLDFRLRRHQQVAGSRFDVPDFAGGTRTLAMTLGSVYEGEPELQARLVEALRPCDEGWKSQHAQTDAAIVLETLLVACHEDRPKIYVGEVAEMANTLLLARQAKKELSAEAIGHILRDQLGLFGKRSGPGVALLLDRVHRQRIHQLAQAHHTLSALQPLTSCSLCQPISSADVGTVSRQPKPRHGKHPAHKGDNLHDVHDLHDGDKAQDAPGTNNLHDLHNLQSVSAESGLATDGSTGDPEPEGRS